MENVTLPVPLAKAVMNLAPAPFLARVVQLVMNKVESRHPKLFKELASLQPALVVIAPSDMPHLFVLEIGVTPVRFELVQDDVALNPQARISGKLEILIDMLEGRVDGDTMFFARDLQITGDTSVIVALRNTLDREEIDLFTEILSLCGPFAAPARMALGLMDKVAQRVRGRIDAIHEEMHASRKTGAA